jgi:YVTN family beta-propeller protein
MSDFFQQSIHARVFEALPVRTRSIRANRLANGTIAFTAAAAIAAGIVGCGSNYRPTTTPIVGTGPASQPAANAFVISKPSPTAQGIGTVIDYSGDTVSATAPIGPGPVTFALNGGGSLAWSLNSDGTVSNIPVTSQLQSKQITYSTLAPIPTTGPFAGLDPVVALFGGSTGLYALDVNTNDVDVLTGSPDAFKLVVPVDTTPVTMVGVAGATRLYSISQMISYGTACNTSPSTVAVNGMADAIETATYTRSAQIQVGVCPVYAVGTPDTKRVFVLNRGSDTISVINSQNNAIDSCAPGVNQNGQPFTCHPSLPLTPAAGLAHAGPVYAEYNQITGQLVVANYDGNTISIIDVSLDEYGNDSATFGTTFTVPVGKNPASVTVLADGSRAYVANQTDGTISIVSMSSHTVEKSLPVLGHPRTVVSTQNSLYGKVYVASPDSQYITIIRTDQDVLSTTVLVQGNAIDVRTSSPDTTSANLNLVSRIPGAGQPCFLPPSSFTAAGAPVTIANCNVQDPTLFTTTP